MFERRLGIVVAVLILSSLVLFGRVFGMQVVGHSYWTQQAKGLLTRPTLTETTRGQIFDFKGRLLAEDTACTDACVDYRAIEMPPDKEWVNKIALERIARRMGSDFRKLSRDKRAATVEAEVDAVHQQLNAMWTVLATLYQPTDLSTDPNADPDVDRDEAITQIRQGIVQMVQARRESLIKAGRERSEAKSAASSAVVRWIFADADSTGSSGKDGLVIEEQQEPHVILHALDSEGCNLLGKHIEDFPGLVLRPSTHRSYPMHTVAAHLLGRMSGVRGKDLSQASNQNLSDLHRYLPNDVIGREGVEALCEPLLRGTRGKIEKQLNDGSVIGETPFKPGADVQLSIDAALQAKVQEMLQHVEIKSEGQFITPAGGVSMHSAAVVLDVKTNEVRVLASNPGFDVNDLETRFTALAGDKIEEPLRNRATSDEFEPGSTVKPLMGLGAITQGTMKPEETVECTGILYLPEVGPDGKVRLKRMPGGRCWVLSEYAQQLKDAHVDFKHHPIPFSAPHPTGFLTFADALERSCDIYFETVADRMGPDVVNHWYDQFGLGRITGIGIYETTGLRPEEWKGSLATTARMNNCLSGMGEGTVWATPLQIANEAATIARGGVWMRPRLLTQKTQEALDAVHARSPNSPPDWVDLKLSPDALRQAKIGMRNAVDGPAGTGRIEHPGWLTVAAKTGTADTSPLYVKEQGADGKIVMVRRTPVIRGGPETETPWYRSEKGKTEVIAWYMGYAPVENPKIAFCVMVEYPGAGGGPVSGPIVSKILDECVAAGYVQPASNSSVAVLAQP